MGALQGAHFGGRPIVPRTRHDTPLLGADCEGDGLRLPLPNVTAEILAKVLEYCRFHTDAEKSESSLAQSAVAAWDETFINMDDEMLIKLILVSLHLTPTPCPPLANPVCSPVRAQAANYLNIKDLLDLACGHVATLIKGEVPSFMPQRMRPGFDGALPPQAKLRTKFGSGST